MLPRHHRVIIIEDLAPPLRRRIGWRGLARSGKIIAGRAGDQGNSGKRGAGTGTLRAIECHWLSSP